MCELVGCVYILKSLLINTGWNFEGWTFELIDLFCAINEVHKFMYVPIWKQWLLPTKAVQFVYWHHIGRADPGTSAESGTDITKCTVPMSKWFPNKSTYSVLAFLMRNNAITCWEISYFHKYTPLHEEWSHVNHYNYIRIYKLLGHTGIG